MKIQKEWRSKEDLCLFNSTTGVKWIDTTLMKSNVCLPSLGNKMTLKWLGVLMKATCPISNFIRYNCLSIEVWCDVTVKGFTHQMPLTIGGLMYSTLAKAWGKGDLHIIYAFQKWERWFTFYGPVGPSCFQLPKNKQKRKWKQKHSNIYIYICIYTHIT